MGRVFIKGMIYVEFTGDQIHTRELLNIIKKPADSFLVYKDEIYEGILPNDATIEFLTLLDWAVGKKAVVVFDQMIRIKYMNAPSSFFICGPNGDRYKPDDLVEPDWELKSILHFSQSFSVEKLGFDKIRPISDDFKLKPDQVLTYPDRFLENRSNVIELVISDKRTVYIYETENRSALNLIFPILKEEGLDLCPIDFIDLSNMSKVYVLNKGQKYQVFAKGFVPKSQTCITPGELGRFIAAVKGCYVENVLIFSKSIFTVFDSLVGGQEYYFEILGNCIVENCSKIRPAPGWKLAKEHQIVNGYLEKRQKQIFLIGANQIDLYDREDILKTDLFEREFPDKKPTKWWFDGFIFWANVVPKSLAYSLGGLADSLETPQERLVLHRGSIFDQFPRSADLVPGTAFEYTILPEGYRVEKNGDIFYTPKEAQNSAEASQSLGETCHFFNGIDVLTTELLPETIYKVKQMITIVLGNDTDHFSKKENVFDSPFYKNHFPDAQPSFTAFSQFNNGYVLVTDVVPEGSTRFGSFYRFHLAKGTGNSLDSVVVHEPGSVFKYISDIFKLKAGTRLSWTVLREGYRFDGKDIIYEGTKGIQEIRQDFAAESIDFEKVGTEEIRIFLKKDVEPKLSFHVSDIKRNISWTFTSESADKMSYDDAKHLVKSRLAIVTQFILEPKDRIFRPWVRSGDSFEIHIIQ